MLEIAGRVSRFSAVRSIRRDAAFPTQSLTPFPTAVVIDLSIARSRRNHESALDSFTGVDPDRSDRVASLGPALPNGDPLPGLDSWKCSRKSGSPDPLRVQVAYQGLKPTELPRPRADDNPEVDTPFRFLDTFTVTMISARGIGQEYYLLIECDDDAKEVVRVYGWVNKKYLVEKSRALEDPGTKLLKKAMIVMKRENVAAEVKRVQGDTTARFGAGHAAARAVSEQRNPPVR